MKKIATLLMILFIVSSVSIAYAGASDPVNLGDESLPVAPARGVIGAESALATINFDDLPGGTEVINQYADQGVTFASECAPGATLVTNLLDFVSTPSSPNCLAPCGPAPYNGGTLILNFAPPVTDMSAFMVDDQFPVQVNAYNAAGALVDQTASDGNNSGFDQVSVASAGGIAMVEMIGGYWSPGSPDGWAIDDLSFTGGSPLWPTAYNSLFDSQADLELMRQYRDDVLAETSAGRTYTELLYKASDEALAVLLDNPELMAQAKQLFAKHGDAVSAVLRGERGAISDTAAVVSFMDAFAKEAPPSLSILTKMVKRDLLAKQKAGLPFLGFDLN